ncbi:MAG: MFS transporter [Ktedonobacteraceae bacterium]
MLLWSGQLVSWIGTEITGIALPLVVLALTGSYAQAGALSAMRGFAYIVLALPAGAMVDRWDRRVVMMITNIGSGVAMGSICIAMLFGHLTLIQLYVVGLVEGSFFVFANLARFAAYPRIVSQEQFPAAVAQTSVADNIALLIGPSLGGFLFQVAGALLTFFADATSYFINALALFFITAKLQEDKDKDKEKVSFLTDVRQGIIWLWQQPTLRFLNILTAGRRIIDSGLYLIVIWIAKQHHSSSFVIGLIFAFGAVGGLVGSLFASRIHKRYSFRTLLLITTGLNCLIFACYAFTYNDLLLGVVTAVLYLIVPVYEVTTATYSASIIPNNIRGRVLSLTRLIVLASSSFGYVFTGWLIQYFSTAAIPLLSGLLLILALITLFSPSLRTA